MAVDDYQFRETDSLVLPLKTFYPLRIPVAHYQLRHYISSPEPGIIYYACARDVYRIDVATRRRTLVAVLPFETRCTAAGHGWVCVGGEAGGAFAAINVEKPSAEVDSLLPVNFGETSQGRSDSATSTQQFTPRVKVERIGQQIVNSIAIHKFPGEGENGTDDIVAILTNNDKTVRLYSLTRSLELTVLDLPWPVNHATMSPDGKTLVAVVDYQQAFFYERAKRPSSPVTSKNLEAQSSWTSMEWINFAIVPLHAPSSLMELGYFTTAWSPSSILCAVASECGFISVIDTDLLRTCEAKEEAIVQVVRSTRANTTVGPGAVRTMCFAPAPWDLLIWSEDHGRVCVSDVRTGLLEKQVLALDPKDDELHRVEIPEVKGETFPVYMDDIQPPSSTAALANLATEIYGGERHRRASGAVEIDNDPHGLSPRERQIIDAIRMTANRESEQGSLLMPRSIMYTSVGGGGSGDRSRFTTTSVNEDGSSSQTVTLPSLGSLREYLRERQLDLDRSSYQPRRQASVVIPNNRSSADVSSGSTSTQTIPSQPPQTESFNTSSSSTWRAIEAAISGRHVAREETLRAAAEVFTDPNLEMRRFRHLQRQREREHRLRETQSLISSNFHDLSGSRQANPDWGVRTAGLAMSPDGRKLYAGTEEGIFEFSINVWGRKMFPAVTPR